MELVVFSAAVLMADLAILDSRPRSQISIRAWLVLLVLSLVWLACVGCYLQGEFGAPQAQPLNLEGYFPHWS